MEIAGTERVGRNAPSGYERACLLELRIARLMSWLLALALPVEAVLGITQWTSGLASWQKLVALFLTLLSGAVSGTCEAAAEKQLREIWTTELSSSPR